MHFFFLSYTVYLLSFQKLHPKKNQPWRKALQLGLAPAANQAEANKLAAKLHKTTLVWHRGCVTEISAYVDGGKKKTHISVG